MKKTTIAITVLTSILWGSTAFAADHGTEAEAQKMVEQAQALIKSTGPEKAYKTFTEHPDGAFKDRDLYVFAYDLQGNCLAQGANAKMVGKNLIDLADADGNPLIKGMVDMVKAKKKGWYGPYKFTNPATKAYEYKKSYCEQSAGETMVCVGIYSTQGK